MGDEATRGTGKSVSNPMRLLAQPLPRVKQVAKKSHCAGRCGVIIRWLLIGTPLILQKCRRSGRRARASRRQIGKFARLAGLGKQGTFSD